MHGMHWCLALMQSILWLGAPEGGPVGGSTAIRSTKPVRLRGQEVGHFSAAFQYLLAGSKLSTLLSASETTALLQTHISLWGLSDSLALAQQ